MNEEWKDIPGYEGRYQVSNLGRVKSLARVCNVGQHSAAYHLPEKIMRPKVRKSGYSLVSLNKDGVAKDEYIHRLVAQSFIPNEGGLPYINHKDENPRNNRVDNLEWCTPKYNANYNGANIRGGLNRRVAIVQKTLDGEFVREWDSALTACKEFGRKKATNIFNALVSHGKKTAYGYKWYYKQ